MCLKNFFWYLKVLVCSAHVFSTIGLLISFWDNIKKKRLRNVLCLSFTTGSGMCLLMAPLLLLVNQKVSGPGYGLGECSFLSFSAGTFGLSFGLCYLVNEFKLCLDGESYYVDQTSFRQINPVNRVGVEGLISGVHRSLV